MNCSLVPKIYFPVLVRQFSLKNVKNIKNYLFTNLNWSKNKGTSYPALTFECAVFFRKKSKKISFFFLANLAKKCLGFVRKREKYIFSFFVSESYCSITSNISKQFSLFFWHIFEIFWLKTILFLKINFQSHKLIYCFGFFSTIVLPSERTNFCFWKKTRKRISCYIQN